jgi:surfactin synthase thioesterase subunit
VCVPPAGGTVASFNAWREPLRERDVAVAAVDWTVTPAASASSASTAAWSGTPGVDVSGSCDAGGGDAGGGGTGGGGTGGGDAGGGGTGGCEPRDGVTERAHRLAEAVTGLKPPWVLVGHSFGGLICYEAARLLESRGADLPTRLVLCAVRPPHHPEADVMAVGTDAEIADRLRTIGGPAARAALTRPVLFRLLVARIRAEIALSASYRHLHRYPLRCPTSVYGGRDDQAVPPDLVATWPDLLADCRPRIVPGGHFFLYDAPSSFLDLLLADVGLAPGTHPAR